MRVWFLLGAWLVGAGCSTDATEDEAPIDRDGDGWSAPTDCDDSDAAFAPDAVEIPYDGIDQDCDGVDLTDADGDGFDGTPAGGDDCDDEDQWVNPDAQEVWYDGVDQDCDGASDFDRDADGFDHSGYGGDDCDDGNPDVFPGAEETWYDGIDADCLGDSDYDVDGDGYNSAEYGGDDCDDLDPLLNGADGDGDTYSTCTGDCDDTDPTRSPGHTDHCDDGIDQDCTGFDAACATDEVEGRAYALDYYDLVFTEPAAVALMTPTIDYILVQVQDVDEVLQTVDTVAALGLWGSTHPLPLCNSAVDADVSDFSDNPRFTIGPMGFTVEYSGFEVALEDFTVDASFSTDGTSLFDIQATALLDTRPLDVSLGIDTCVLAGYLGDVCIPCADGVVRCLATRATAAEAPYDPDLDVVGECGL